MTREINHGERDPTAPRQEWRTPRALAARLVERYRIDLDAMATAHNRIVPRYIAPPGYVTAAADLPVAWDALTTRWADHGRSIFVNPPFALLSPVVGKMIQASDDGARVVLLAPDNGDTRWYAALVDAGASVYRFRGRVSYEPEGATDGKRGAAFPSAYYVLARGYPREPGAMVPTWCVDAKTFEVL